MIKVFSRFVVSSATLAGMTVALLAAAAPAEAGKMSCIQKYRVCDQRCARDNDADGWMACHNRTCGPQYDECVGADAGAIDLIAPVVLGRYHPEEGRLTPRDDPSF